MKKPSTTPSGDVQILGARTRYRVVRADSVIVCTSDEHLRRVCRKELGRSPMPHLTFLRLQRAQHLLSLTDGKVEVIANSVGFESSSTFSNTFKKWIGWRPSEQRDNRP